MSPWIAIWLGTAAAAPPAPSPATGGARVVLDLASLASQHDPVARDGAALCADGSHDGEVLGTAVVVYGRRPGPSAWGHISLRFLACEGDRLRDVEFEATRLDSAAVAWFRRLHPGEGWYEAPGFRRRQRDRLVLFRNEDPVDRGVFAAELRKNREVHEAWMPWPAEAAAESLAALDAAYEHQLAQLRAGEPVDRPRYRAMSVNCTMPVREAWARAEGRDPTGTPPGSPYPLAWLRQLERDPEVLLVVHPSAHVLASIQEEQGDLKRVKSGAPARSYRPVFRRRMDHAVLRSFQARIAEEAWSVGVAEARERLPDAAVSDGSPGEDREQPDAR